MLQSLGWSHRELSLFLSKASVSVHFQQQDADVSSEKYTVKNECLQLENAAEDLSAAESDGSFERKPNRRLKEIECWHYKFKWGFNEVILNSLKSMHKKQ